MPRQRLSALLRDLTPRDAIVVADMTNTLLRQTPDGTGYPAAVRALHRTFLAAGGALVVVTGDSLAVAREQFLAPLGFTGGDLILVTGGGHRADVVKHVGGRVQLRNLFRGRIVPIENLSAMLWIFVLRIEVEFGSHAAEWFVAAASRLLSPRGARLDIAPHYPEIGEPCYIEIAENKGTCFFPRHVVAKGRAARFLDRLAADPLLAALARSESLHIVRGPNFVDAITCDKGEALDRLATVAAVQKLKPADRTLVVMGDSVNDHPMYAHTGIPCRKRVLIYLGGNDVPVASDDAATSFVHLPNEGIDGGRFVFEVLTTRPR